MKPSLSNPDFTIETRQLKIRLLYPISLITLAINIFALIILLPQYKEVVLLFMFHLAISSSLISALYLVVRRGQTTLASIILLGGIWTILTIYILISGGLHSPIFPFFLIIIFLTSILLGGKAGVWAFVICLTTSVGLYLAGTKGYLQQLITLNEKSYFVCALLLLFVIGILNGLYSRWTQRAFERVQQELNVRNKVEKELRRNQSLLKLAQQLGKIGHYAFDMESGSFTWSDQLFQMLNMEPGEIKVTPELFTQAVYEEDRPLFRVLQQEALDGKRSEGELRIITKENEIRYIHVIVNLMSSNTPQKIILGTVQDISDRKLAEMAHKFNEERYRTFMEQATEGIWRLEFDRPISTDLPPLEQVNLVHTLGYVAECNDALAHMYGYSLHTDMEGKRLLELYGGTLSEKNTQGTLELINNGYRSSNRETLEYNALGEPVYFLNSALGIIRNNVLVAIWGTQQDISSLKKIQKAWEESEEIFRSVIEQSYDGITIIDQQGLIVQWNQAMENLTGIFTTEAIGKSYLEIMAPLLPKELKNNENIINNLFPSIEKFALNGDPHQKLRIIDQEIIKRDGVIRFFQQSFSPIKNQKGFLLCVITRDISEQKKFAEEIQRLNTELEQRVMERTHQLEAALNDIADFSYSIAHDLRAPLRGIDGYSKLLVDDYASILDKQAVDYLDQVRHGAQKMGQLLDDMLILLRIIRTDLKPKDMNLSVLMENILESYQRQDPDHQTLIQIKPDLHAFGDPSLLITLLDNLASNAWKFSRQADPTLIEFGSFNEADNMVFYIRDNGIGFDMVHAKRLFSAFQRLHDPEVFEGTGIGLAIAQRIVQRHGGSIWAESEVNKGSTFYFTLGIRSETQPK